MKTSGAVSRVRKPPDRYEIDMVGLQGQVSRLEITTAIVDYEGSAALLITGVEIIPTQTVQQLRLPAELLGAGEPGMHSLALESLAEAVITTDAAGLITYINPGGRASDGQPVRGRGRQDSRGHRRVCR